MAYKNSYTLNEFWAELTQGTLYKAYAKANPKEAAELQEHVAKKIAYEADFIPADFAKTHTGKALVMMLLTLHVAPKA